MKSKLQEWGRAITEMLRSRIKYLRRGILWGSEWLESSTSKKCYQEPAREVPKNRLSEGFKLGEAFKRGERNLVSVYSLAPNQFTARPTNARIFGRDFASNSFAGSWRVCSLRIATAGSALKALAIFDRRNKCFHHLGIDVVAVELI